MVILHILHGYDIQLATKLKAAFKAMFLANPQEHNIYGVAWGRYQLSGAMRISTEGGVTKI